MALRKKNSETNALKSHVCQFFPFCKESFVTNEDVAEHMKKHRMRGDCPTTSFFDGTIFQTQRNSAPSKICTKDNSMAESEAANFSGTHKLPLNEITNLESRNTIKEMDRDWNTGTSESNYSDSKSSLGILNLDEMSNFSFDEVPVKLAKEPNPTPIQKPFNSLFQNFVSSTFQESCTPSKINPFSDVSSFQVDDIFKSSYNIHKVSGLPERPCAALEDSKISFCIDQISGKSSMSSDKTEAESSKESQENTKQFSNLGGLCDFNLEENSLGSFDEIFNNNSGFRKDLEQHEKDKVGDSNLKVSRWSVQSNNQYVKRPSWWSDITGNDDSYISATRFIAAKTEPISAFGISEFPDQSSLNRDSDSHRSIADSHQSTTDYYENSEQEPTKEITRMAVELASANTGQEKTTSGKTNINCSDISYLVSKVSMSEDLSVIANKLFHSSTGKTTSVSQNIKQNFVYKSNVKQNNESPENIRNTRDRVTPPCQVAVQSTKRVSRISSSDTLNANISPTSSHQCASHSVPKMAVNVDIMNCTKISSTSSQESSCSNCSQTPSCLSHTSGSCRSVCSNTQQSCLLNAKSLPEQYLNMLMQNQNFQSVAVANSLASRTLPSYALPFGLPGVAANSVIIMGPTEINQPIMCLGDNQKKSIELRNITNVALFYHLTLTSATLNDEPFVVKSAGVTVPNVVSVAAAGMADITVEFLARVIGKLKLTLRVVPSFSSVEESPVGLPLSITILFETVEPRISLQYKGKDEWNIGSIVEKSSISKAITLANHSMASVPLKLDICSGHENHSLEFNVKKIKSRDTSAIEWLYVSPRMMLCRLQGAATSLEPRVVKIPVTFHSGRCMTENENLFFGMITANLECTVSKQHYMVTEMLKVFASIGSVNISIVHPTKLITLKAEQNSKSSCLLRVVNTGTVPVLADLAVHCESEENMEEFYILPPTIELQPKIEVMINVYYKPSVSQNVKGVIQAAVQNDGEVFNLIEVEGVLNKNQTQLRSSYHRTSMPRKSAGLSTSKKFMAWGGVVPGKCSYNNVVVRNRSSDIKFSGSVYIKESNSAFHLIGADGSRLEKMHLELPPNSLKDIQVSFSPTDVRTFQGNLVIKPNELGTYNIPLSGYGGLSDIYFHGLQQRNNLSFVQLSFQGNEGAFVPIKLSNNGSRAAYVAAIGILDIPAEEVKFIIEPAKFVLLPNQVEIVSVKLLNLRREMCIFQADHRCGSITFYYGDEILRQKLRSLQNQNAKHETVDPKKIKFESNFKNEDSVPLDGSFIDSKDSDESFYSNMKSLSCDINFGAATDIFDRTCDFDTALSLLY